MQTGDWQTAKEEIRERLDIAEVIGRYVALRPAGQNMKGLCPFHKEKTPSFNVHPAKQIWHCFGCGRGGDVFSFVEEYEGLTFPEVLRRFAEETGVKLGPSRESSAGTQAAGVPKGTLLKIHELAVRYYYDQVRGNDRVVEYFKARGLSPEIVREFKLGYAPQGWDGFVCFAGSKGIKPAVLVSCGLAIARSDGSAYDRFRDRIMFPIFDISGRPIAFGGRSLDLEVEPKYLNSPETALYRKTRTLYGLNKSRSPIKEQGYAVLVEGYMDYLSLYQAGIGNCVATSGTALTPEHGQILRRFTPRVVLLFDGDSAGVSAAERAVFVLAPLGLDVRVLILPATEDPDSYVRARGADDLRTRIETARGGMQFAIAQAIQTNGVDSPQGKSAVVNHMAPLVKATTDPIVAAEYVKQIAEATAVREQHVRDAIRRAGGRRVPEEAGQSQRDADTYLSSLEGHVLALLITHPALVELAMERISPETFTDSFSTNLFSLILDTYRRDATLGTLMNRVEEGETRRVLSRILVRPWPIEDPEQELRHGLARLESKRLKNRMRVISSSLRNASDERRKKDLLGEQKQIAQKIKELEPPW
ncbi:MAG: DNA primase [Chitinivibrionales bacterium]|nr:DNA primase [Chitinivibrionales bacterium]MBD3396806.1 DNA primase [Chitinivibrionales bacterium]